VGAGPNADALSAALRSLPSVERLAAALGQDQQQPASERLRVSVARETIRLRREQLRCGLQPPQDLLDQARAALARARTPALRPVINATGVIVHTNLGRAPLGEVAARAVARVARAYTNLELDLQTGGRGARQVHVRELATTLTGAEAALAVNNAAAAVLLAAAALAGPGRSLIVSRGQLIEIGGSFRIPEVIAASGARLVEVGTTNRTRLADYQRAIATERAHGRTVGAVLRAHPSNFRTLGFVEDVPVEALCGLDVPVIDDVGSGVLGQRFEPPGGLQVLDGEPAVRRSVSAGAALVCFSGDKLLGGPQAGLLVGQAGFIERAAGHPLARAVRIDKLSLAALEATLVLHRDPQRARQEIPVLAMLDIDAGRLQKRAQRLQRALSGDGLDAHVVSATARVGGGGLPLLELEGPAVRVEPGPGGADADAAALRGGDPPVIARVTDGAVLLDPRTIDDAEIDAVAAVCLGALIGVERARVPDGRHPR
jgi:L-seryl-tRNA(Ser) seleniumtransferase